LLTNHLRLNSFSNLEYLNLIQDIHPLMLSTKSGRTALIDSGVYNVIIDICFTIADNPINGVYEAANPAHSSYAL